MFFSNNRGRRSGYEIFMDCCCVIYEYKVVKIDELVRKANLGSIWRDQIIDFLLVNNYCHLIDNRLISLTKKGEEIVNYAPNYRKSHDFYVKNYKGEEE